MKTIFLILLFLFCNHTPDEASAGGVSGGGRRAVIEIPLFLTEDGYLTQDSKNPRGIKEKLGVVDEDILFGLKSIQGLSESEDIPPSMNDYFHPAIKEARKSKLGDPKDSPHDAEEISESVKSD